MADSKSKSFASPRIAREVEKQYGSEAVLVKVRMRSSKDVSSFIRMVKRANRKAEKSKLAFD
jgi:hypothetical protein